MGCSHPHTPVLNKAFFIGIVLNLGFVAVELFAGYYAHSLALIADAVHNLGDAFGLVVSWLGYTFSFQKPNRHFTYGMGRASIFATVLNGLLLCGSTFWILKEALERLNDPTAPLSWVVGIIAAIGIVINTTTALVLLRGRDDINVKSAVVHMFADAAVSAGVVVSAVLIATTGALWIDPLLSALIAVIIFVSGWPLLVEGLRLSLDAVPKRLDADGVRAYLNHHPDLQGVFDLHIWALSTTKAALSAHLTLTAVKDREAVQEKIHRELKQKFGITHVTLQVEHSHAGCTDEHETIEDRN
jgi:cobalt-zinc-cadmium efflux system protein